MLSILRYAYNGLIGSGNTNPSNSKTTHFQQLIQKIANNDPSLTSLDLEDNDIGDDGANALAQALETNTSLTSLNLGFNNIGDEIKSSIDHLIEKNRHLLKESFRGFCTIIANLQRIQKNGECFPEGLLNQDLPLIRQFMLGDCSRIFTTAVRRPNSDGIVESEFFSTLRRKGITDDNEKRAFLLNLFSNGQYTEIPAWLKSSAP